MQIQPATPGKMLQLTCIHVLQGTQLFSPDGAVFLIIQSDGNLVLYNTAKYASSGPTSAAAFWSSGTYGTGHPAPFQLNMQPVEPHDVPSQHVCCLVISCTPLSDMGVSDCCRRTATPCCTPLLSCSSPARLLQQLCGAPEPIWQGRHPAASLSPAPTGDT